MGALTPSNVKIGVAEFLAALITCETFSGFCSGKYTHLEVDNTTARAWFNAARCSVYPFDRCSQGLHMYMLNISMKIKVEWISSGENSLADKFSRRLFPRLPLVYMITGVRYRAVKPKWLNVMKFIKS